MIRKITPAVTRVASKQARPTWVPPASIREEHAAAGTPLPAPATAGVLGLGLVILGALGRRARRDPATATPRV